MVEITQHAEDMLYKTVSRYVGRRKYYGPPPIFYWQYKVKTEVYSLEQYDNLPNGFYRYNMEYNLGIIHFAVSHLKDKDEPVFIINAFEFNNQAIPDWRLQHKGNPGLLESFKKKKLDNITIIRKLFEYDL